MGTFWIAGTMYPPSSELASKLQWHVRTNLDTMSKVEHSTQHTNCSKYCLYIRESAIYRSARALKKTRTSIAESRSRTGALN